MLPHINLNWQCILSDFRHLILAIALGRAVLKTTLPAFKVVQDFGWTGYKDMPVEMVQVLKTTHKQLRGLDLV